MPFGGLTRAVPGVTGKVLEALGGVFDRHRVANPADAFEFQRFRGGRGEVPSAPLDVGTAIDDRGDDRVAVPDELHRGAAGERLVGDADRRRPEGLSAGGRASPHAGAAVPAGAGVAERGEGEFGFVESRGGRRFGGFGGDRRGAGGAAGRGLGARRDRQHCESAGEERGAQAEGGLPEAYPLGTGGRREVKFPRVAVVGVVHVFFGTLAGLADGLALKELRYTGRRRRFAPTNWVPRSSRYVGEDSARSCRQISKR